MSMEMGNARFPSLPWDSHVNKTKLLKLMGMGQEWE